MLARVYITNVYDFFSHGQRWHTHTTQEMFFKLIHPLATRPHRPCFAGWATNESHQQGGRAGDEKSQQQDERVGGWKNSEEITKVKKQAWNDKKTTI